MVSFHSRYGFFDNRIVNADNGWHDADKRGIVPQPSVFTPQTSAFTLEDGEMAETQRTQSGFWAWIVRQAPDWLGDALMGALLVWILGKRPGDGAGARAGTTGRPPMVDIHGELLVDLQKAVSDMSQPIWQRHRAAVAAKKDDEWEALLSKVPKEARPEIYVAMNKMGDVEFEECMDLLRHNRILQFLERVALHASPVFQAAWAKIKAAFGNFNAWLEQVAQTPAGPSLPVVRRGCFSFLMGLVGVPLGLFGLLLIGLKFFPVGIGFFLLGVGIIWLSLYFRRA